jgi:hypothetical protein
MRALSVTFVIGLRRSSARARRAGSLTAKPLTAGSRSVMRPRWERTIARALLSETPGSNWAIATTLRRGCFLATDTRRALADWAACATGALAANGIEAAISAATTLARRRRVV